MNTIMGRQAVACTPAMGGTKPGLIFISSRPVFDGSRRESGFLLLLIAAASDGLVTSEAYRVTRIHAIDPELARKQRAFTITAIDAKRIHAQLQRGETTAQLALAEIRKRGQFEAIKR